MLALPVGCGMLTDYVLVHFFVSFEKETSAAYRFKVQLMGDITSLFIVWIHNFVLIHDLRIGMNKHYNQLSM